MELKDFIEHVLVDIAEGITSARDRVRDKIAINPASVNGESVTEKDYITFDVAVTITEKSKQAKGKSIKGGAKISVIAASAGGEKKESSGSGLEKTNRVSFQVPVYYSATFNKQR